MKQDTTNSLWLRWIAANAIAEFAGLGATFAVIGLLSSRLGGGQQTPATVLISLAIAVASGAIEATLVGAAQWWAMRPSFSAIRLFEWWRATLIGALIGYVLGYLPSTLMSIGETAGAAPVAEPPQWVVLLLAAGLGGVAGAVLSFAQWLVLRKHVRRAGLWIPANMLAWAFGMPVIFESMDLAFKVTALWQRVSIVGTGLLAAGAIVGAIHGRGLVALAGHASTTAEQPTADATA